MNPGALRQLLFELIDYLRPYHLMFAGLLLLVLLIGGIAAECEGFGEGWPGSATRGLMRLGFYRRDPGRADTFRNDQDLVIRYDVDTTVCDDESSEPQWFRIRLSRLFSATGPPSREEYELHRGEIPPAVRATLREVRSGPEVNEAWPPSLAAAFGDCVVATYGKLESDCTGERRTVKRPVLFKDYWFEEAWWRTPMRIIGLPFALVFDALTIPLNAAVVAMFAFPLYFDELAGRRRYYWRCGLATALACDIMALLLVARPLTGGHTGGGGLGGLLGPVSAVGVALFSGIIPAAAGYAVAKETGRARFVSDGMLGAVASTMILGLALLVAGEVVDEAEDLPGVIAWLLNPFTLIPGLIALAIVIRGAKHIPGTPAGS